MTHELMGQLTLHYSGTHEDVFKSNPVSATQLGELIDIVTERKITGGCFSDTLHTRSNVD